MQALTPSRNISTETFDSRVSISKLLCVSGVEFCYITSTLLRKINQGDIKGACDQLRRWTYAGGKQWKGLMTRREIEREICLWGQQ